MRPIDADALIDDIKHVLWDWNSVDGITATTVLKQTISDIGNQPTVDAVPVIRCKDCKYAVDEYNDGECYCDYNRELRYIKEWSHYCGWGERKEE